MHAATRKGTVTFKGSPLELRGRSLAVGEPAPVAEVTDNGLALVPVGGPGEDVRIFVTVPSLDTAVCDLETRRFNEEAAKLGGVQIDTISVDLPMAQKRWCGAAGVTAVRTLSDHKATAFGDAYGVTIVGGPLARFLARAVFVVDRGGTLRHVEYVADLASQPDYASAVAAAKAASGA